MKKQIQDDLKEALKAGDDIKKGALRMLLASLVNKEKESGNEELSPEQIQQVVATEAKKRREAAEAFQQAGKEDMAEQEKKELQVLQVYLPDQLPEEKIRELVENAILKTGASGAQDMGKVMAALMPDTKGKADGAAVSSIVKELLS
jgi:uncharacterized protein